MWLQWLLRITDVLRITEAREAAARAAELYELLNDAMVPSSFDVRCATTLSPASFVSQDAAL